jgi:hypothetical protein
MGYLYEIITPRPHQKLKIKPPFPAAAIIGLKASITITKRMGERGCLRPRELLKKPLGVSLIMIEK